MGSEPSRDELLSHVDRFHPGRARDVIPATAHAREVIPSLQVARYAPSAAGDPWVYATVGAWEASRELPLGIELLLLSPRADDRHVETISSAAYYHAFYGLDEGSVYRVARGWFFDSLCDRLLATAPEPRELEWLDVGERRVHFLRLLPVTAEEAELLAQQGRAALDARFAAKRPNFLDPKRRSVV